MILKTLMASAVLAAAGLLLGSPAVGAEPASTYADRGQAERKVAANDLLFITIVGERDLQTEFRVSSSGTIQYPFIDEIEVAGLTPAEIRTRLREILMKDYFVDPQVVVTVKDYRSEFVRVIGQVNRPGPIQLTGEQKMDVIDVITLAGGTTIRARNAVEYTRNGVTRTLKLDELKKETDPSKKIWVQPGDIIDVKESVL